MWNLLLNILILIFSLWALIKGANIFINQASAIARKYRIPEFLIGITVVAFGTSLPEFIISLVSTVQGNTTMTVSNIVGSCIANIGFILAITAMFGAIKIHKSNLKFDIPLSVASVLIFLFVLFLSKGQLNWWLGIMLLVIFTLYFFVVYRKEKKQDTGYVVGRRTKISPLLLLLGLILIGAGGKYAVDSTLDVARLVGISEGFAGFTILSIGSSLPELIVSITALRKGKDELSLGNIIGSNFFNLFFVVGISSLISNLSFSDYIVELVILVMYNLALLTAALIGKRYYISRREGVFLLISYIFLIIYLYYR